MFGFGNSGSLHKASEAVRSAAVPISGSDDDYDELIELIGNARIVLLGEASHGTDEFYRERARITRRLIEQKGFNAVAVEADWPDALRVARYARGGNQDPDGRSALGDFKRFPIWMWRNEAVLELVEWLRAWNSQCCAPEEFHVGTSGQPRVLSPAPPPQAVGFYGIDLYSLHSSIESVLEYLDKADPEGARRARERYGCFDHFGPDPQAYGYVAGLGLGETCEREVIEMLRELRERRLELIQADGKIAGPGADAIDEQFYAEQNARVVQGAEQYYRSMFRGRNSSWNLRDTHMADTLSALMDYIDRRLGGTRMTDSKETFAARHANFEHAAAASAAKAAKVIVWAHNSHLGDARATEMGEGGEINLGQLARERFGHDCVNVGFTTHSGWVTAASEWGGTAMRKRVRPSLKGSVEEVMHAAATGLATTHGKFFLRLRDAEHAGDRETVRAVREALTDSMLERAIGVIYLPQSERMSHYFHARVPEQFDALIHIDVTHAVVPLDRTSDPHLEGSASAKAAASSRADASDDVPETFPWGV